MSKHQKASGNSSAGSAPKVSRIDDVVFGELPGISSDDAMDPVSVLRAIRAFQGTPDDRALEVQLKARIAGRMVTLDNMKNSEFYKRKSKLCKTPSAAELGSREKAGANGSMKYADFGELGELWRIYAQTFMGYLDSIDESACPDSMTKIAYQQLLLVQKFELVGSSLKIASSSNKEIVGMEGIVVEERENIFRIIDRKNKLRSIPKGACTFSLSLQDRELQIHGPDLSGIGRSGSIFRASGKLKKKRDSNKFSFR